MVRYWCIVFVIRWQWRSDGGTTETRRSLRVERDHIVGYWVCGTQPTGCLHAHLWVQRLDQPDITILVLLKNWDDFFYSDHIFIIVSNVEFRFEMWFLIIKLWLNGFWNFFVITTIKNVAQFLDFVNVFMKKKSLA